MDTSIEDVTVEIKKVEREIENVETNIRRVEEEIERRFGEQVKDDKQLKHERKEKDQLRRKEEQLRRKEEQLRNKEEQLRRKEEQLRDERKLQLLQEERLLPNPGAPCPKKPKRSQEDPQPVNEVLSAETRYFQTLLEPPADLPRTPTEVKEFLTQVPVKLPLGNHAMYQKVREDTLLTEDFIEEANCLPHLVVSALITMDNQGLNEATSSAKLYQITGQFIRSLNDLAPLSRRLHNVLVILDSSNPKSPQTASQPLERLARPDLQLFVKGCLILRWENKVDYKSLQLAVAENTQKLRSWSPLFYGGLPYVVGGCCAGNQFQWLMLKPNVKGVVESDFISPLYDLNSLKGVAAFLHSNVRMHCLLQKLQECLGESIKLVLYTPENRGNGVTITFYPDLVKKEIQEVDEGSSMMRERLYAAVGHSKHLIHGQVRRLRKTTVLTLEPVGDPNSVPISLNELENATHDILCGLKDLHKAGYTHRDIRWENCIKVNTKGICKWILIDLEAAGEAGKEVSPSDSLRTWDENTLEGKKTYTKASDWYLLGKLVVEWLTGKSPLDEEGYQPMKSKAESLMGKTLSERQVEKLFCERTCQRCKNFANDR